MNVMPGDEFVDTNIWVYAHLDDPGEPRAKAAWQLIKRLPRPVVSAQVIAEYFSVMRRNGQEDAWAQRNVERMLQHCRIQTLDLQVIHRAIALRRRYGFPYWDCQILAAALAAGCSILYTEDLQHGQRIEELTVIDPLKPDPTGVHESIP